MCVRIGHRLSYGGISTLLYGRKNAVGQTGRSFCGSGTRTRPYCYCYYCYIRLPTIHNFPETYFSHFLENQQGKNLFFFSRCRCPDRYHIISASKTKSYSIMKSSDPPSNQRSSSSGFTLRDNASFHGAPRNPLASFLPRVQRTAEERRAHLVRVIDEALAIIDGADVDCQEDGEDVPIRRNFSHPRSN
jgi:hypothetical protein